MSHKYNEDFNCVECGQCMHHILEYDLTCKTYHNVIPITHLIANRRTLTYEQVLNELRTPTQDNDPNT
jgi:hypothetical protein